LQGLGNQHLVWRRQFGYGAGVGIYAIANASPRIDNRICIRVGTNDDHRGPNAGAHVDVQL